MPLIWWRSIRSPWGERSGWWTQMHNISATRQHVRACVKPTRPRLPLLWGSLVRKRLPRTLKYGNITDRKDHRSGLCVFLRSGKCDVASAILLASIGQHSNLHNNIQLVYGTVNVIKKLAHVHLSYALMCGLCHCIIVTELFDPPTHCHMLPFTLRFKYVWSDEYVLKDRQP